MAVPSGGRAMASTGRRGSRRVVTVREVWRRQRPGVRAAVVEGTTSSRRPARAESASRVRTSLIPASTSFTPNNVRNPSAAVPKRARAWEMSWRLASVTTPWLAPSATSDGRSCRGAMLASSSRTRSTGGPVNCRGRGVAPVGGGPHVPDDTGDERREMLLVLGGRGDEQRGSALHEAPGVEALQARARQGRARAVAGEHSGRGRPDRALFPLLGLGDPEEKIEGEIRVMAGERRDETLGGPPVHRRDDVVEWAALEGCTVEDGGEKCGRSLGPVRAVDPVAALVTRSDHRLGHEHSAVPRQRGRLVATSRWGARPGGPRPFRWGRTAGIHRGGRVRTTSHSSRRASSTPRRPAPPLRKHLARRRSMSCRNAVGRARALHARVVQILVLRSRRRGIRRVDSRPKRRQRVPELPCPKRTEDERTRSWAHRRAHEFTKRLPVTQDRRSGLTEFVRAQKA